MARTGKVSLLNGYYAFSHDGFQRRTPTLGGLPAYSYDVNAKTHKLLELGFSPEAAIGYFHFRGDGSCAGEVMFTKPDGTVSSEMFDGIYTIDLPRVGTKSIAGWISTRSIHYPAGVAASVPPVRPTIGGTTPSTAPPTTLTGAARARTLTPVGGAKASDGPTLDYRFVAAANWLELRFVVSRMVPKGRSAPKDLRSFITAGTMRKL